MKSKFFSKLNPKQRRFAEEYVIDSDSAKAAIRAGYSKKTAVSQGSRCFKHPIISKYILELQKEIRKRNEITIDECVQMLSSMARFDVLDIYNDNGSLKDLKDIPKGARMAIESLDTDEIKVKDLIVGHTKKVKLSSRRANIIELMKHLGGYKEDNDQKRERIPSREDRDEFLNEFKKIINAGN